MHYNNNNNTLLAGKISNENNNNIHQSTSSNNIENNDTSNSKFVKLDVKPRTVVMDKNNNIIGPLETVQHVLLECPATAAIRSEFGITKQSIATQLTKLSGFQFFSKIMSLLPHDLFAVTSTNNLLINTNSSNIDLMQEQQNQIRNSTTTTDQHDLNNNNRLGGNDIYFTSQQQFPSYLLQYDQSDGYPNKFSYNLLLQQQSSSSSSLLGMTRESMTYSSSVVGFRRNSVQLEHPNNSEIRTRADFINKDRLEKEDENLNADKTSRVGNERMRQTKFPFTTSQPTV